MTTVHLWLLVVCFAALPVELGSAQRYCTVPCGHRLHPYDIGPCRHACYGPYGGYPCHPQGDTMPCMHPVHPYDYVPC